MARDRKSSDVVFEAYVLAKQLQIMLINLSFVSEKAAA